MAHLSKLVCFLLGLLFISGLACEAQKVSQGTKSLLQVDSIMSRRQQNTPELIRPGFLFNNSFRSFRKTAPTTVGSVYQKIISVQKTASITPECQDTSYRLVFEKSDAWFANDFITKTKDGNILIPGFDDYYSDHQINAHLVKCTQ